MKKQMVLSYRVAVFVAIILIIAASQFANLLRSRMAATRLLPVGSLRTINTASARTPPLSERWFCRDDWRLLAENRTLH